MKDRTEVDHTFSIASNIFDVYFHKNNTVSLLSVDSLWGSVNKNNLSKHNHNPQYANDSKLYFKQLGDYNWDYEFCSDGNYLCTLTSIQDPNSNKIEFMLLVVNVEKQKIVLKYKVLEKTPKILFLELELSNGLASIYSLSFSAIDLKSRTPSGLDMLNSGKLEPPKELLDNEGLIAISLSLLSEL